MAAKSQKPEPEAAPSEPAVDWRPMLRQARQDFDREREDKGGHSDESLGEVFKHLCSGAGQAAWELLHQREWPIQDLPQRFRTRPVDKEIYVHPPDPETGERDWEWDTLEGYAAWWLALIGWFAERPDIPVRISGRACSSVLHDLMHNLGCYRGVSWLPLPQGEQLRKEWPHICSASVPAIDYLTRLLPESDTGRLPGESDPSQSRDEADKALLLDAIKKHPDGKKAKRDEIIEAVGRNKQRAGRLLRELEASGQYTGFTRRPRKRRQP